MAAEETIDIKQWQKILDDFSRYPKEEDNSTFLDMCHYSGERFEEICSRILKFFFTTNEKHGFRDLWFQALFQLINTDDSYNIYTNGAYEMGVCTEDYTYCAEGNEKKRIDIVIETPTLAIAIENKIDAPLYNQLEVYKEHIYTKYPNKQKIFVVLTARALKRKDFDKAKKEGFKVIEYKELFDNVTSLLGGYASKCDQKYLIHMLDFIQTVKNRANIMTETDLDKFIAENKEQIDELIKYRKKWADKRWANIQREGIKPLREIETEIKKRTKSDKWTISDDNIRLYNNFCDKSDKEIIGIDSNFNYDDTTNNPVGKFCIFIATTKEGAKKWSQYKQAVTQKYPNCYLDEGKDNPYRRIYLHLHPIERKNFAAEEAYQDEIIKKLNEYYNFLKEITDNIDK